MAEENHVHGPDCEHDHGIGHNENIKPGTFVFGFHVIDKFKQPEFPNITVAPISSYHYSSALEAALSAAVYAEGGMPAEVRAALCGAEGPAVVKVLLVMSVEVYGKNVSAFKTHARTIDLRHRNPVKADYCNLADMFASYFHGLEAEIINRVNSLALLNVVGSLNTTLSGGITSGGKSDKLDQILAAIKSSTSSDSGIGVDKMSALLRSAIAECEGKV